MVEVARRRHATALRRYAHELAAGGAADVEPALAATWTAFAQQVEFESEERGAEWLFADLRRRVLSGGRPGALAAERAEQEDGSPAAIFAGLTPKQQEVLHLKFGSGFRHEQIARILELAPATAAQLLHVALARLAVAFRRTDAEPASTVRGDDPRLTLAALGELDPAAWRSWEATQVNVSAINERLEEVRRAAKWVAEQGLGRRRRGRSPAAARRNKLRWLVPAALALVVAAVLMRVWPARPGEVPPPVTVVAESASHPTRVAVQTREQDQPFPRAADLPAIMSTAEPSNLGVFRTTEAPPSALRSTSELSSAPPAESRAVFTTDVTNAPPAEARGEFGAGAKAAEPVARPRGDLARETVIAPEPPGTTDLAPILALKRALGEGRWPQPEEVPAARLKEHFARRQPRGERALLFAQRFETATAPWDAGRVLVRGAAQAPEVPPAMRASARVILLLDVSGSMDAPNRLPLVQEAVRGVLARLRPDDRVGLVTYAGESQVRHAPTPLSEAAPLREGLLALQAGGRTNGGAGLAEAFALARAERAAGEQRVILCTDGEFNMGSTSPEALAGLVRGAAEAGVRLSIFGFGRSGAIDPRLEQLAALGGGGSGYVNTRSDAVRVLLGQLGELIAPVAREVRLTLAPENGPAAQARDERLLPEEEIAALVETAAGERVEATLEYQLATNGEARFETAAVRAAAREFGVTSAEFRFAAAVHRFADLLAGPPDRAARELDAVEAWAREAVDDAGGYRAELLALVQQARTVAQAVAK